MSNLNFPEQNAPVWLILSGFEVLLYLVFLKESPLRKEKVWQRRALFVTMCFLALFWKSQLIVYRFELNFLFQIVLFYLMARIICRDEEKSLFYSTCLYVSAVDICRTNLMFVFEGLATIFHALSDIGVLIGYILFCMAAEGLLCYVYKTRIFHQRCSIMTIKQILLQLLPLVPYAFLRHLQFRAQGNTSREYMLLIFVSSVCTLISICSNEYAHIANRQEAEREKMELLLQEQKRHYESKLEWMERVKRQYHDIKKHLITLERLSNSQQVWDSAQAIRDNLDPLEILPLTGNEIVDVLLSERMTYCKEHGICLEHQLALHDIGHIQPLDMAAIFGNALDNAVEAVENLTEEKRKITVKGGPCHHFCTIVIRNSYQGKLIPQEGFLATTKKHIHMHGYGLKNIQYTLKKYGGLLSFDYTEDEFILSILIPLKEIENKERE